MASSIRTQPEHARLLGIVTAEWSVLESMLMTIFLVLLGTDHTRAHAVFSALQSYRAKSDVVKAVGSIALRDQPNRLVVFKQLMKKVDVAARKRNEFVHSTWGVSPTTEAVRLINLNKNTQSEDVEVSDLEETADEIVAITADLHRFSMQLAGLEHLLDRREQT